jgi:hypothetical protein
MVRYLFSAIVGLVLYVILINITLNHFHFEGKAAVAVMGWSMLTYAIKAIFFYLPLFKLTKRTTYKGIIWTGLSPFLLYSFWFGTIILFRIETLWSDVSWGYISYFPHFGVQLFTTLLVCIGQIIYSFIKK